MRHLSLRGSWMLSVLGVASVAAYAAAGVACSASKNQAGATSGFGGTGTASSTGAEASGASTNASGPSASIGTGFAMASGSSTGSQMMASCKVTDDGNAVPTQCTQKSPPNSFTPVVKWFYDGPPADPSSIYSGSFSTPLVANMTDDNGDGAIDLCDTPDVIIQTIANMTEGTGLQTVVANANMAMLAGDTGALEVTFDGLVDGLVYPALGDIDGDGIPEVLAADTNGDLVAYDNKGHLKWTGDQGNYRQGFSSGECTTIAIYDLDGDGNPEILFGWEVYNNKGKKLWGDDQSILTYEGQYWCNSPTAADLDGDGKLEVIMGNEAYHHDGTLYWQLPNFIPGHPHVANFDGNPNNPQVIITNTNGITLLNHDGSVVFKEVRPTGDPPASQCWGKPAVIHDFDGDGHADFAAATCNNYTVYTIDGASITPKWTNPNIQDLSGLATATAFDFLGSGSAEAMYADETTVWGLDGKTGSTVFQAPRQSGTLIEFPIVADIDNDGSADVAYVSNFVEGSPPAPGQHSLIVMQDAMKRWIPARRIWNQYSYHVTNVREDGTIPKVMKNNWQQLNTFRTNSQIDVNGDCNPNGPPK